MSRESTISIYRSSTPSAVPSGLTSGELAVNMVDRKLFVGGTNGNNITFLDASAVVTSFNGLTGDITGLQVTGDFIKIHGFPTSSDYLHDGKVEIQSTTGGIWLTSFENGGLNFYNYGGAETLFDSRYVNVSFYTTNSTFQAGDVASEVTGLMLGLEGNGDGAFYIRDQSGNGPNLETRAFEITSPLGTTGSKAFIRTDGGLRFESRNTTTAASSFLTIAPDNDTDWRIRAQPNDNNHLWLDAPTVFVGDYSNIWSKPNPFGMRVIPEEGHIDIQAQGGFINLIADYTYVSKLLSSQGLTIQQDVGGNIDIDSYGKVVIGDLLENGNGFKLVVDNNETASVYTNAPFYAPNIVNSINGLTGAFAITGDGGAVYGVGNNRIAARLASMTVTGVASFAKDDFVIGSTGHVGLTSTVARTNSTNNFTAVQAFPSGVSADWISIAKGATFASYSSFLGGLTSANLWVGGGGATFSSTVSAVSGLSANSLWVGGGGATFSSRASFPSGITALSLFVSDGTTFANTASVGNYLQIAGATAWHASNDGKDSGLDGDLIHAINGRRFTENLQKIGRAHV